MNVAIINPFVEATLDVTTNMAQLTATIGKPNLKKESSLHGDITGFIELNGTEQKGTLALSFTEEAILLIYERMLGEEADSINTAVEDLTGEFTNMVCGGAKQRLAGQGFNFDLTRPSIIQGKSKTADHIPGKPVIELPIQLEGKEMYLEVCLAH